MWVLCLFALKQISASILVFQIALLWFLPHCILLVWHIVEILQNISSTDCSLSCLPEFLWPHFFAHIFFCHFNEIWRRREANLICFTCHLKPQVETLHSVFRYDCPHRYWKYFTHFSFSSTYFQKQIWMKEWPCPNINKTIQFWSFLLQILCCHPFKEALKKSPNV